MLDRPKDESWADSTRDSAAMIEGFPNLFSIGGMRCGSTMLFENLNQHPQVFFPEIKEPDFLLKQYWLDQIESGKLSKEKRSNAESITQKGKIRTIDQYLSMYENQKEPVRGDASHYLYHPVVIDLIKHNSVNPKVLVSFRDPIDRLFSEFMYLVRIDRFQGTFAEFVERGLESRNEGKKSFGLDKGFYGRLLKPWIEAFGESSLKIVIFEELTAAPKSYLADICNWLGIDSEFEYSVSHPEKSGRPTKAGKTIGRALGSLRFAKRIIPKGFRQGIRRLLLSPFVVRDSRDAKVEESLKEFYKPEMETFCDLIGKELTSWKTLS